MAPTRSKKRKSTESQSSIDVTSFPPPPSRATNTIARTPGRTPTKGSPIRKKTMRLTVNQKQALIDNLQLEVTERARKLRAQYNMQAQGLRARIEIRVNRIPMSLRRANMGELFLKHSEGTKQSISAVGPSTVIRSTIVVSPSKNLIQQNQSAARNSPSPTRVAKRQSDEMIDKENNDLANPKKRSRVAAPAQGSSRARLEPNQVLSPRSANSRTLPRSPVRPPVSPGKSYLARPVSPNKTMGPPPSSGAVGILTTMVEKAKSTRAATSRPISISSSSSSANSTVGAGRGRKAPQPAPIARPGKGRASNSSQSTDASSGTTIVSKVVAGYRSPAKKTVMGTIKGMGGAATKKPVIAKTAAPTRVLRKRN